jgi:hypothetical protein
MKVRKEQWEGINGGGIGVGGHEFDFICMQLWRCCRLIMFVYKKRKATLASSYLSVCPSVLMEHLGSNWTD